MEAHTKRPSAEAGPSGMSFGGDTKDDTATLDLAQAMQRHRLQRDHGLSVPLAALIAGLCFGEGTV